MDCLETRELFGRVERYRLIAKGLHIPTLPVFRGDRDFGGQVWHVNEGV